MGCFCNAGADASESCHSPPVDVDDRRELIPSVDSAGPVDEYYSDAASFVASVEGYLHMICELAPSSRADADLWEVPSSSIFYKSPWCVHPELPGSCPMEDRAFSEDG